MSELETQIKQMIIDSLDLEDITPQDIVAEDPLFDEGLGLDSIDALELGMALQQTFGVRIDAEDENTKNHFRTVQTLARFVAVHQAKQEDVVR